MAIKRYKPTTPGRRGASVIARSKPARKRVKSLIEKIPNRAGRNNFGKITVRHKGGRGRRAYRKIDFSNPIEDYPAKVIDIQYDPNRTADIALIEYENGSLAYTIAVGDLKIGDKIIASRKNEVDIKPGNRMLLKHIPAGIIISSIELKPKSKAVIARSAGSGATVLSSEAEFVVVKMPSGEVRKFNENCLATIGSVGNSDWNLVRFGKAGRMRLMGVRPRVRGKAMNPVDHPHGGGEGRSPIGLKMPKTKWGKIALGVLTRKRNKSSDLLIIRKRKGKNK